MTFLRRSYASRTPRQRAGDAAEQAACAQLEAGGCRILARNVAFREGELDIVAQDGATLVFAEVRLRTNERVGGAAASVDRFKQKRIARAAQLYLARIYGQRGERPACRFDVFAVDGQGGIEWIRDAFPGT